MMELEILKYTQWIICLLRNTISSALDYKVMRITAMLNKLINFIFCPCH